MNKTGKIISSTLYVLALVVCAFVRPGALAIVAVVGVVLFFVIHLALRARGGAS